MTEIPKAAIEAATKAISDCPTVYGPRELAEVALQAAAPFMQQFTTFDELRNEIELLKDKAAYKKGYADGIEAAIQTIATTMVETKGHPQIDAPTIGDAQEFWIAKIRALTPQAKP